VIAALRRRATGDRGYSLIELMVSMGILSILMVVVLGSILSIYSAVNQTEGISFARDQIGNTFRKLDKEVRYASWVSAPGQVGNRWYLEFATPNGCRQLKLAGGVLTMATWTLPGSPGPETTIATDITLVTGVLPYAVYTPGSMPYATQSDGTSGVGASFSPEHTQVRLQFNATIGKVTSPVDIVFTAANTSRGKSNLNGCSAGRPTT
jgi:prepilin-type N-terminal cleavage/methylation domain-containing protein